MAEEKDDSEKTEEPSQHRIDEFRKKGEVASSKELTNVILLAGTLFTILLCSVYVFEVFQEFFSWLYQQDPKTIYDKKNLGKLFTKAAITGLKCVAPAFGASFCLGFISQFAQIGFLYSPEVLGVKLDRINPINGFKRLFSKKALVESIKGVFKFAMVLSITYAVIKNNITHFLGFLHTDAAEGILFGKLMISEVVFSLLLGLGVVALMDFAWEKYNYRTKLRMTKQEVKDEHKEKDGNPEVKNKIRQIQRQMAQKRMMDDVKNADVIVTNPTHISVALKYEGEKMVAPEVRAKGADHLALKIREIAKEHDIPIVENIMLARTLYKTVKVGQGVPRSLYKAIAEVLAFVYKRKRQKKSLL